jgi:hypothetical protein
MTKALYLDARSTSCNTVNLDKIPDSLNTSGLLGSKTKRCMECFEIRTAQAQSKHRIKWTEIVLPEPFSPPLS